MSVSVYKLDPLPTLASARGFTLIEVVIVMSIVAILTAIALPNYTEYVLRSNRSTAQSFLTDAASRQAQFFLDRRTYATTVAALNMAPPADLAARYTFAVVVNAGPPLTYLISATPTGPQTHDRCGVIAVDQAGNKTAGTTRCW